MEFESFPKIPRLSRDIIITEKLDGTNATVWIDDLMQEIRTGSRNRWITPEDDNYGFAKWAAFNKEQLLTLGPGWHRGEWWGQKIQRGYGLKEKRFSLFNTSLSYIPECCSQVPVLYSGPFDTYNIDAAVSFLKEYGSTAAPGFMKPEGVCIFHTASMSYFKKMIDNDKGHKG